LGEQHCARLRPDFVVLLPVLAVPDSLTDAGILDTLMPLKIEGATGATDLVVGTTTACTILADRTVSCWGHNDTGQLGDGAMNDSVSAVLVSGLSSVTSVALATAFAARRWATARSSAGAATSLVASAMAPKRTPHAGQASPAWPARSLLRLDGITLEAIRVFRGIAAAFGAIGNGSIPGFRRRHR
jgi:hypothetical protein